MTAVRVATAASRYDRYQPEHHAFEDARHRPEPEPHRKLHDLGLSGQILTRSVSEVRADALLMLFEVALYLPIPKGFKLLAGDKRSAITGFGRKQT